MRYDSEHKARTRDLVLKHASASIRENGPERMAVADVMARAGLTHGGFYAHFKSKDDLITQAVGHMFDERYAAFFPRVDLDDPNKAVSEFIDWYLSMKHRAGLERGCPLPTLSGYLHHLPTDAQLRFALGAERLAEGLCTLLTRIGLPSPERAASSTIAELIGAISMARACVSDDKAELILEASRLSIRERLGLPPGSGIVN